MLSCFLTNTFPPPPLKSFMKSIISSSYQLSSKKSQFKLLREAQTHIKVWVIESILVKRASTKTRKWIDHLSSSPILKSTWTFNRCSRPMGRLIFSKISLRALSCPPKWLLISLTTTAATLKRSQIRTQKCSPPRTRPQTTKCRPSLTYSRLMLSNLRNSWLTSLWTFQDSDSNNSFNKMKNTLMPSTSLRWTQI